LPKPRPHQRLENGFLAASDLAYHTARTGLHSHLAHDLAAHADDWRDVLGALGEDEYLDLAASVLSDDESWAALNRHYGRWHVSFWADRLHLPDRGVHIRNVWVDYDLERGQLGHIMAPQDRADYITSRGQFQPLRGAWPHGKNRHH